MNEEGETIDLRTGRAGGANDAPRLADADAVEMLANALRDPTTNGPPADRVVNQSAPLPPPAPAIVDASVCGPNDTLHVAPLKQLGSLPRKLRRRIDVDLAEGETVECAVLAAPGTSSRWALATTHRVVIEKPEGTSGVGAMSLPYHRTTASVSADGTIRLRSREFDRVRSASLRPDADYLAETAHLISRLPSE